MMDALVRDAEVETDTRAARRAALRRVLLLWVLPLVVVVGAVLAYGLTGRYVSTDNAYLQQDRVDVAPQISGNVLRVEAIENARVTAGQPILVLDDTLPRIAVDAAQARLAAAHTEVAAAKAAIREKQAQLAVANRAAEYSLRDLKRQQELADRKLVPASALDAVSRSTDIAVGTSGVIKLQIDQAIARLGGHPDLPDERYSVVRTALADLERARTDLERTVVRAPQSGIVSHLPQVGARVDAGRPAFAVVTDRAIYVTANFKETDLEWVRPGQRVKIDVDTYSDHAWQGRVESIAQATGAEFALLPPQNASGNWVKVVQRIPVRIALERGADEPPLRAGMSADVEIDTGPHTRFDRWFGRAR